MVAPVKGERRVVTFLFCAVKGSTTIAERLDPGEGAEIVSEAFAHLIAPIERYEGLAARLMAPGRGPGEGRSAGGRRQALGTAGQRRFSSFGIASSPGAAPPKATGEAWRKAPWRSRSCAT